MQNIVSWFPAGWNDLLTLLHGPSDPPFTRGTEFSGDFNRLMSLLAVVILFVPVAAALPAAIAQGYHTKSIDLAVFKSGVDAIVLESPLALLMLLGGLVLAVLYTFVANICRIDIKVVHSFYIILFLVLPWIPPTILVRSLGRTFPNTFLWLVVIWVFVAVVRLFQNFFRGVEMVLGCGRKRLWASLIIPVLLMILLIRLALGAFDPKPENQNTAVQPTPSSQTSLRSPRVSSEPSPDTCVIADNRISL